MNSTKRKFNALLNGIGSKAAASSHPKEVNNVPATTPSSTDADSLSKKRRLADVSISQTPSVINTKTSSAMHTKSASVAPHEEAPKYAPWDRAAFLKRLKSFSNLTDWSPKPARVNEVEWAKRGWVCQKFERVRCCSCNVEILVKLNKKEVDGKEEAVYIADNIGTVDADGFDAAADSLLEEALVNKYAELILTSHDEDCLWRKRGCDDTIFKLPLSHAPTAIENLKERYTQLCARKDTLPYMFNLRTPEALDLDLTASYLPKTFFAPATETPSVANSPPQEVNKLALTMALFGWQGHTHERLGPQLGSVSCQACFRVLGLWLFKSKQVNEAGEEEVGPVVNGLDVVKEHREYCPWRNAASQNGQNASTKISTSTMEGWEIMLRILKNDHCLRVGRKPTKQPSVENISDSASMLGTDIDDADARSIRDEEDKKRWARLRRVKSLFDTKGGKKLSRTNSKPKPST